MPYLETPDELAEALADRFGVYGAHPEQDPGESCTCRVCFVSEIADRIRNAAANERRLAAAAKEGA